MNALDRDIGWILGYRVDQIKADTGLRARIKEIYQLAFGEKLVISCGNCIGDALIRFKILVKKQHLINDINMNESKYKLKPNTVIDLSYSTGGYVTNANLTDDKARELLERNFAYLKFFDEYPKDEVDKILGNKVKTEVPPIEDEPVEDQDDKDAPSDVVAAEVLTEEVLMEKTKEELFVILGDRPNVTKVVLVEKILEKVKAE